MENPYATQLRAYMADHALTQEEFARRIGRKQGVVSRYVSGTRLPEAEIARDIDAATDGAVSFETWRTEFLSRATEAAA